MNRILLVEDDERLQQLLSIRFRTRWFLVFAVANGTEALKQLENTQVEVIITDIMMPVMDGYELLETLRSSRVETPVLIIKRKQILKIKKGFQLGTDDYMTKPVDVNEMVLRVEALLRRAKINHSHQLNIGQTS